MQLLDNIVLQMKFDIFNLKIFPSDTIPYLGGGKLNLRVRACKSLVIRSDHVASLALWNVAQVGLEIVSKHVRGSLL